LDARVEFLHATNFTPRLPPDKNKQTKRGSLLFAMNYYGLDGMEAVEKERWRKLILSRGPWTNEDQRGMLDYCEADVRALYGLCAAMTQRGHMPLNGQLNYGLLRGRYMRAAARMQSTGIPIDFERRNLLVSRRDEIKKQLVETLGRQYGVFDEECSFNEKRFVLYLNARGIGWPTYPSGRLDLRRETFKRMALLHPELELLRQLRRFLDELKLWNLSVGSDGVNRCWLNPFGSRTSRNQPSNSRFVSECRPGSVIT
jgi:hypothetical protein